jgi:hypothetical protein
MNGDSRETGKLTPDGAPDPSVFSTEYNIEGIRVGTAVCVMAKKDASTSKATVFFRHFWGVNKKKELLESLKQEPFGVLYSTVQPEQANRYSFRPENISTAYAGWPRVTELCEMPPSNGLMEKRGGSLIDIDLEALESRMKDYFDSTISWDQYKQKHNALTLPQARFDPIKTREKALQKESYYSEQLLKYAIRPFEIRWCYYTSIRPIWNEPRPVLYEQCFTGNAFVLTRVKASKSPEGAPFYFCKSLSDDHLLSPDASCFPLLLAPQGAKADKHAGQGNALPFGLKANLSMRASVMSLK